MLVFRVSTLIGRFNSTSLRIVIRPSYRAKLHLEKEKLKYLLKKKRNAKYEIRYLCYRSQCKYRDLNFYFFKVLGKIRKGDELKTEK